VSDEVAGSTLDPSAPGTLLPDSGKDEQPITATQRNSAHQDSDGDSENSIAHLFFPQGFKPLKASSAKKCDSQKRRVNLKRRSNPYSKSAFVFDFSSSYSNFV